MSNPGYYAQQAARAGADAARRASQAAMDSHRLAMARHPRQPGYRPSPVRWIAKLIGWLFTAAFLLVFLAVGTIVVLSVLQQVKF